MTKTPPELRYAASHEWLRLDGDVAVVGITDYAQDSLTDVVYVELPKKGDSFDKGATFGAVESVKSVSEVYAPISGTILEVNEALVDAPEKINEDPYGEGWLIKLKPKDPSEADTLLDAATYNETTGEAA